MLYNRKMENMRKIIVSQAETIEQLNKEIKYLTDENQRLQTNFKGITKVVTQYEKIISELECQNDMYAEIKNDMEKMKRKLKKKLK